MTDRPKRKLIEVALPLEKINAASAREKSIRHGHPSTLHLWWARRPLAACRAVLFASLVDDPSSDPDRFPTAQAQEKERRRLFDIIERLVLWENTTNEAVLEEARAEIRRSTNGNPPPVLDPFCGGGSIPLEAQRLGLTAYASDLNPVAVLITKALIEIPPKFAGRPPVHPDARRGVGATGSWKGAAGLAEDVRRYGAWMRDEAERRIGHLYPMVRLPREHGGGEATVIAWLWARRVTCPNPACGARMPLVRSFALSTKKGKEAWVEPIVDRAAKTARFEVRTGRRAAPDGTVGRQGARCIVCGTPVPFDHVRSEGRAGRMDARLMAIVAEGTRGRIYLPPDPEHERVAVSAVPAWAPETDLPEQALGFRVQAYGMTKHRDLFTPRQLVALTTFSDLVGEARERVFRDAISAGLPDDAVPLHAGGSAAPAYADAVATYLAFAVDRSADFWCTLAIWSPQPKNELVGHAFGRQALPMTWDFGEINPFSASGGNFLGNLGYSAEALARVPASPGGQAEQLDATQAADGIIGPMVATDPPYYDNIGYADLADFFYVWLRRSVGSLHPDLFSTLLTPKSQELVATPYRFGGDRAKADRHFEEGLGEAFARIREAADPRYPMTLFYAYKQAEDQADPAGGVGHAAASTGWETMLGALLHAGFRVTGTWPMRTERDQGLKTGTNVLASSVVLACRPRPKGAPLATRREFAAALKAELPGALERLQHGAVAPVDLAQAAIGPGMAIFSRYSGVIEADGSRMSVRRALELINAELDTFLSAEHGELDRDSRWCVSWFKSHGFGEGPFGEAETLAKARDVAVGGLVEAGVLVARGGKVRLFRPEEYDPAWDPGIDTRLTVWECVHQLIRELDSTGAGIEGAARLAARMGPGRSEEARELAYTLYGICERKKWADEAIHYNQLATDWPAISERAQELADEGEQGALGL